jgi:hypothetical protein
MVPRDGGRVRKRLAPVFHAVKALPYHYTRRIADSLVVVSNMHVKGILRCANTQHRDARTRRKGNKHVALPVDRDEPKGLPETPLGTVCPVILWFSLGVFSRCLTQAMQANDIKG